jgi:hypothetical protein
LAPNQTPQMVLINFSGALNELVFDYYRKILGYNSKFSPQQTRFESILIYEQIFFSAV